MPDPVASRYLVISDLHAFEDLGGRAKAPSALHFSGADADVNRMFEGIKPALDAESLGDLSAVVCAGDMTDRAEPGALVRVWSKLTGLADQFGCPLVATAGNHDFASHPERKTVNPKETLLDLDPKFPLGDDDAHRNYFAFASATKDIDDVRLAVFNSCDNHGYSSAEGDEYEHGRVTSSALRRLQEAYQLGPRPEQNVLITHHHPVQLPHFDTAERSQIIDAGLLLKALEDDGPWLVIHGHKHRPWLHYAQGGGDSPIIFSAGSFSADLGGDAFGGSLRNQFYVVELLTQAAAEALDLSLAGTVYAWSRVPYGPEAWTRAGPNDGMSWHSGFGWRVGPRTLARRVESWLETQSGTVTIEDIVAWEPRFPYATPNDVTLAYRIIRSNGKFEIKLDDAGNLTGIQAIAP